MNENDPVIKVYDGIYILNDLSLKGRKRIDFEGKTLYSFMDSLFTENPNLDELAEEQVSALCRARAQQPDLINNANIEVKNLLAHLLEIHSPSKVLEIGSGTMPIPHDSSKILEYVLSDADSNIVEENNNSQNLCVRFSSNQSLGFENNYFDLIIAAFVFHFKIHDSQLSEIARCLNENGAIVINIYRRSPESREVLAKKLQSRKLKIIKIMDRLQLCREHEYWVIGNQASESIEGYAKSITDYLLKNPKPTL